MKHTAVEWAQTIVRMHLKPGGTAIDATAGNGWDTLFLAQGAGPEGKVYAFDTQRDAIEKTRARLKAAEAEPSVVLLHAGHETMAQRLPTDQVGRVQAIMFNLGYLPAGDKARVTRPDTTISALSQALTFLAPEGVLTIVSYWGHPGGAEELESVRSWAQSLDPIRYLVLQLACLNNSGSPPVLIAVEQKRGYSTKNL